MTAVLRVSVIMYAAGPVIDNMGYNDQQHRHRQQQQLVLMPQLLGHQEAHSCQENQQGNQAMVMLAISMIHGPGADTKSKEYHEVFKEQVINDVNPKNGQTRKRQR